LATAAVGVAVVFGRQVRKGAHVELAGKTGTVLDVTLMEVHLRDTQGCDVRVPHLLLLAHPLRFGAKKTTSIDLIADARASQTDVVEALARAAREYAHGAKVDLVYLDEGGAYYRVSSLEHADGNGGLVTRLVDALKEKGIALGRGRAPS